MLTLLAFLVAIGVLVAVHEWGHFAAARVCGVQVLQFSVGIGPAVFRWVSRRSATEYRIGCFPVGGYVKMLGDEGEAISPGSTQGASFPEQPWHRKAGIAIAGPLANLVFAAVLFSVLGWHGLERAAPVLGAPAAGSRLAQAGFLGGERVLRLSMAGEEMRSVETFEDLRWVFAKAATQEQTLHLEYQVPGTTAIRRTSVSLQGGTHPGDGDGVEFYRDLGLQSPFAPAVLGELQSDGAALAAGLRSGDRVVQVDGVAVVDAAQLRDRIRQSGASGVAREQLWSVQRADELLTRIVKPIIVTESDRTIGRVGAVIGQRPEIVTVRYGILDGGLYGLQRTWDLCAMTWRTLARMVVGQGSLQQLSGPLTIADYAGRSAALGFEPFVNFLALLSVSLGVLNLLPVPILDGGHLMYYLWESLYKRPVPAKWAERLQKAGLVVLVLMMSLAIFNDVARLLR